MYGISKARVPKAPPRIIEYRSFKYYNRTCFTEDLKNIDWNIIDYADVDSGVNLWNLSFTQVAESHAPIKKSRIKGIPAPWMTSELSQMMHNRDYHLARAVKSKSEYHWSMYRSLRSKVNKMVKSSL